MKYGGGGACFNEFFRCGIGGDESLPPNIVFFNYFLLFLEDNLLFFIFNERDLLVLYLNTIFNF